MKKTLIFFAFLVLASFGVQTQSETSMMPLTSQSAQAQTNAPTLGQCMQAYCFRADMPLSCADADSPIPGFCVLINTNFMLNCHRFQYEAVACTSAY